MGYWGNGYWAPDYWSPDYWASGESAVMGESTLYVERVVEVLKFTLTRKDGLGTDDYYVSQDYWDEGTLYTGNPVIYPVLAELVSTQRSVGPPASTAAERYHRRRPGSTLSRMQRPWTVNARTSSTKACSTSTTSTPTGG